MCGLEPDVFRSLPEDHFVKFSYSEGTDIGAADINRTRGLFFQYGYIYLQFILCFGGYS